MTRNIKTNYTGLHLKYFFLSGFILNILLFQKFSFPRECQCLSWYDWFAKWELLRFDKWPKPASGEQTPSNHFHPLPFNFGQNIIWNWKVSCTSVTWSNISFLRCDRLMWRLHALGDVQTHSFIFHIGSRLISHTGKL